MARLIVFLADVFGLRGLSANAWVAVFTVVLAGIALLQALIYGLQRRTTHRAERAYIWVRGVELTGYENTGARALAVVTVINSGRTPARIIGIAAATLYETKAEPRPQKFPMKDADFTTSDFYMVTGQITEWGSYLNPPSDAQKQAMIDHEQTGIRMLLLGQIRYKDRFQLWGHRHTNFTFEYDFRTSTAHRFGVGPNVANFNIANDAYNDAS